MMFCPRRSPSLYKITPFPRQSIRKSILIIPKNKSHAFTLHTPRLELLAPYTYPTKKKKRTHGNTEKLHVVVFLCLALEAIGAN